MERLQLRAFSRRIFLSVLPTIVIGFALLAPLSTEAKAKGKGGGKPSVPPPEELKKLSETTMLNIDKSLETGDFSSLRATLSPTWRKQVTPEKLAAIFQGLIDTKQRLNKVQGVEPVFEPAPEVNPSGLLVTSGYYPTMPYRIRFTVKYYNDGGPWRPFGFSVNPQEVSTSTKAIALPSAKECETIAGATLLELESAFEKSDFTGFQQSMVTTVQRTATPEKLKLTFAKPMEAGLHLEKTGPEGAPQITFTKPPALDPSGDLRLTGTGVAKPAPVNFVFSYRLEGSTWRLLEFNVDGVGADLDKAEAATKSKPAPKEKK